MYDAILSSEDPRYYQHGGVDLIGTARALLSNARGGETQGGSSISQQYVKNVLIQRCEQNAEAEYEPTRTAVVWTRTASRSRRHAEEALQNCWTDATTAQGTDGIPAQAPGDALRDRARAEVLEERDPARLPQHRELRRHDVRHRRCGASTTSTSPRRISRSARPRPSPASCRTRTRTASTSRRLDLDDDGSAQQGAGRPDRRRRRASWPHSTPAAAGRSRRSSTSPRRRLHLDQGSPALRAQPPARRRQDHPGAVRRRGHRADHTRRSRRRRPAAQRPAGAAYFCQYVRDIIKNDPAFGATRRGSRRRRSSAAG